MQHTLHSRLAKHVRERLSKLEESSGRLKIKIVEKGGTKLTDLLHKSNAWSSRDCLKEDCLMCASANITYETFCITCQEKTEEEGERKDGTLRSNESNPQNEELPNISPEKNSIKH